MSKTFFLLSANCFWIGRIFAAIKCFKLKYGRKILDRLAEIKQMRGADMNELMSLKQTYIKNAQTDSIQLFKFLFEEQELASIICLPIMRQEERLGTLIAGKDRTNVFMDGRAFYENIANQIGIGISNARLYAKMNDMAIRDGLTRIYNRRYLTYLINEYLSQAMEKKQPLSLALFDIDKFKMINDTYGQSRIECDKPGIVTVKYTLGLQIYTEKGTWATRYYEGTQNIVFSDDSIGKTVVMSIGSSEIVVDGEKAAIDAAPVVQNNRTYVPFRALAEAFGAEVAYDETTQAVTATLGSTTVVMTIGSAAYTVNGTEKTADVAPFISGGRTMVPVRFAAEAFGSKVIPTYDENGATADVLFKL